MTTTLNPMLEALEIFKPYSPTEKRLKNRLRAFLSDPLTVALQDPCTAAAMRVLLGELPRLMEMEAKATTPEWIAGSGGEVYPEDFARYCRPAIAYFKFHKAGIEKWRAKKADMLANTNFVCAARNTIHRAAQAKRKAEEEEEHP